MQKNKIAAFAATVLIHAALLLILLYSCLTYPPTDEPIPIAEMTKEEILFGGEFVMLGDNPWNETSLDPAAQPESAENAEEVAVTENDMRDAGEANDKPKQLVTTEKESPMKVAKKKETEKSKGATKSQEAEQEKIRAQQNAQKQQINERVSFGKAGASTGSAGSPNGNATTGARAGKPGVGGLDGYTLESWGRPSSGVDGSVTIRVVVNARGKVTSAYYSKGSGSAAASAAVRESCRQASLASQFSVPQNTTQSAIGYITWNFK